MSESADPFGIDEGGVTTSRNAQALWDALESCAHTVAQELLAGSRRVAFHRVQELLEQHGFDFCFELTCDGANAVLALTPEGDPAVAQQIDQLVHARPDVHGWRIHSRVQRKRLPDALTFVRHMYGVEVADASYDVAPDGGGFRITMYCSAFATLSAGETAGLIATLLDHALGEHVAMALVTGAQARVAGRGALSLADVAHRLGPEQVAEPFKETSANQGNVRG